MKTAHPLYLLPVGPLTPDDAREWLDWFRRGYGRLIRHALLNPPEDAEDRAAFEVLSLDLEVMVEACVQALTKATPVKLEREDDIDAERHGAEQIARILAQIDTGGDDETTFSGGDVLPTIATLARELANRLHHLAPKAA